MVDIQQIINDYANLFEIHIEVTDESVCPILFCVNAEDRPLFTTPPIRHLDGKPFRKKHRKSDRLPFSQYTPLAACRVQGKIKVLRLF
jgi:hypothetical protein